MVTDFDRWVAENNPSGDLEHAAAFWDYIEILRRFAQKFDVEDMRVIGTYTVRTPPPEEKLLLPAVSFEVSGAEFALKWDFGAWPNEWTLSVRRSSPYRGPTLDLFDPERDVRQDRVDGLSPAHLFPPFSQNPAQFSCELYDEWDVATFVRLLGWHGR